MLRQLVMPHNPIRGCNLLSSPSPAPNPIRGGAGTAQRGKSPCWYLQDIPWLPVQVAASSRRSRTETFMSIRGSASTCSSDCAEATKICVPCCLQPRVIYNNPCQPFHDSSAPSPWKEPLGSPLRGER